MTTAAATPSLTGLQAFRRWVGPGLAAAIVLASVAGTWLAVGPGERSLRRLMDDNVLTNAVNGIEIGLIAGILTFLRPGNRVGWLLAYAAAANALAILGEGWALASYHVDLPGRTLMAWLASWIWVTALILGATVLPAIYPTGRAVGRFGRWVVRLGWGSSLLAGAAVALLDDSFRAAVPGHDVGHNPLSGGALQPVFVGLAAVAAVAGLLLVVATLVWTLRRLRRAASPEREQLAWLLASVVPAIVVSVVASPPVMFAVNLLTSVALVVGIVRHGLFDIKLVLRSGLLYGLLLAVALAAYVAVVELVTLLTPGSAAARLFAAAAVALLVVPVYRWLAGAVGRLVYGDRADPVRALGRIGRHLGGDEGVDLPAMAAAVAASVRSPHVQVRGAAGAVLAETGTAPGHPVHEVMLHHAGDQVGVLAVAWRTPTEPLSSADRRLVDALAIPVAVALRAAQLAEELGESRARVLAVRERERRSLRNDLHDGLGPSLSGVALGIEAARRGGDPTRVEEILDVLQTEVNSLVDEVRSLIDDLGPAGLADGGLPTALRSHAEAVNALDGVQVHLRVGTLPALPRPVEVALHRVAGEALTNVVRHAGADRAWLWLEPSAAGVRLVVEDDGRGVAASTPGVGRTSMGDRVAAVGGTLVVADRSGGGTRVEVEIPLVGGTDG
jgi:signal transduction histidine kinase